MAVGGTGRNVLTAAAEIDTGTAVRIHGSRVTLHEFPLEWVERALKTLVRMIASQLAADIARRRVEEVNTRLTGLVDLSLVLGQEVSFRSLLLSTDQLRMLEVMERNSIRFRKLIEDLLVLDKKEGDLHKVEVVNVNMRDLIIETCQELTLAAQRGSITLDIDAVSGEANVLGDRGQLKSAVANIVSNAIKFSRPGTGVTVHCQIDKESRRVKFTCQDSGIGIPSDDQKQLFNRFYRASNASREEIAGTGLGLSIVKQIVDEHGGEVNLTSIEGEGTTVVVDLPLSN